MTTGLFFLHRKVQVNFSTNVEGNSMKGCLFLRRCRMGKGKKKNLWKVTIHEVFIHSSIHSFIHSFSCSLSVPWSGQTVFWGWTGAFWSVRAALWNHMLVTALFRYYFLADILLHLFEGSFHCALHFCLTVLLRRNLTHLFSAAVVLWVLARLWRRVTTGCFCKRLQLNALQFQVCKASLQ